MSFIRKTAHLVKSQLQLMKKHEFLRFFREISKYFPRWMLKISSGTIMKTSSPQIVFRKYKNYIFDIARKNDIPEIVKLTDVPESILNRRLAAGDICHIARDIKNSNNIVNVIWVHLGACYIMGLGLSLDLTDDSAYLYGGYTAPEVRMKGIFNTAFKVVHDFLTIRGISNIYGLIEGWNRNAYNLHLRLNFKPIGRIIFFIVMFIKFSIYTDLESGRKRFRIFLFFPKDQTLI